MKSTSSAASFRLDVPWADRYRKRRVSYLNLFLAEVAVGRCFVDGWSCGEGSAVDGRVDWGSEGGEGMGG